MILDFEWFWCAALSLLSKPLMDLLVTLCAKYHLNPSSYTLELVTTNSKNTKLKPNVLIGTLDVEKILLKPKGEDKNKKTGPQMPEVRRPPDTAFSLFSKCIDDAEIFCWSGRSSVPQATVRMVINYKRAQKTILRVSPRVPLADHLPAICEKCEFDVESTVLLRDVQSLSPLDLSCSLNDYAIREVYARDTKSKSSVLNGQSCYLAYLLYSYYSYSFVTCCAGQSASPASPASCHAGIKVWNNCRQHTYPADLARFCNFGIFVFVYSVSKQRQNSKGRRKQRPFQQI